MILIRKYVTVAVGMLFGIVILQVRVLCKHDITPWFVPAIMLCIHMLYMYACRH